MIRMTLSILGIALLGLGGCAATYTTPGAGARLFDGGDADLREHFAAEPAAAYPANIAVIRVQDRRYVSLTGLGYGHGRFSVITARDVESDESFRMLGELPDVRGVAPIGRMLVPAVTNSIDDLREPAARLRADMLLVYTVDSSFVVDGKQASPLSVLSLGFVRNKDAVVTSTVAGALIDVRTGFVYGTTEATERQVQQSNLWSRQAAIDSARIAAERLAFDAFVESVAELWSGVLDEHASGVPRVGRHSSTGGWHHVRLED